MKGVNNMASYCYECKNSKRINSKIYKGKCSQFGCKWLDFMCGCIDGEKKDKIGK